MRTSISHRAWNGWYHCMGHTYGTWLPGEEKGFRTRHHREHVEGDYKNPPPRGKYDGLKRQAQLLMKRQPIFLEPAQAALVVRLLVESLQRRGIEVAIASVDRVHFHILAKIPDGRHRHWLGVAKKESSHYAKEAGLGCEGGLWAVRTKAIPCTGRGHQVGAGKYIFDHREAGAHLFFLGRVTPPANWRHA
jgi:hypothetical protein